MRRSAAAGPVTQRQSGRLRSEGDLLCRATEGVLGVAQPNPGHAAGSDIGSQYRSAIFWHSQSRRQPPSVARRLPAAAHAGKLQDNFHRIVQAPEFYFAEGYHQQYLADTKNPYGYCPDHGTGVSCPIGVGVRPE